ncbi:hypothetical protein L6467_05795 [Segatella bryantii]|uniref:hypothetical protein n=1 Tax=Segatella bryantii TaxID=77095 RepID=UPI001EDC91CF|nr:hypothetical protein [Segatella bryantii]UKK73921.1 hypothetical protein L6467_05795 [Segatella bryantii]
MDREKLFEKFLEDCKNRKEWCGQGNPNADILIIGKEPHNDYFISDKEEITRRLLEQENICRSGFGEAPRDSKNPTWCNYQMLIEKVYRPQKVFNPALFDFEKYAFTTEINTIFRPKAVLDAETRNNIDKRLCFFKDSEFINSFPVIILACNNFISNDKERGFLINNTFGVKFDGKERGEHKEKTRGHWFYTHHSDNGEKLVIHTRQLSFLFDYSLLEHITDEIKEHLRKLGLI